jgi:hypothetical protein
VLGLGKKRNKRKKQNGGNLCNAPTTVPPPAARYASPQPVRSVAKLQGVEQSLGIPAEIPNSKKKSKKLKKV